MGISLLTSLFNKIWMSAKIPEEWRLSEGGRRWRLSTSPETLWKSIRKDKKRYTVHSLIWKKAYDSVPRELIWRTLQAKGVTRRYISVIRDMYDRARAGVRTPVGSTELFLVEMSLHQGSELSPYLFTLILDKLSNSLQEELPWCMIFADDIALITRSTEELNCRLEKRREALKDNGLCVSREKTEYLRCDFDKQEIRQNGDENIRIGERILVPKVSFRYLGSVMHKSGGGGYRRRRDTSNPSWMDEVESNFWSHV
uniref:uncharacterized protein LOC122603038 n=1 Tax=Erigeron canadensis TaxID=72917 RepID=UPI001CB9CB87|nr:uncharacterized protein LOC122603038 [Erigeron canadensis]